MFHQEPDGFRDRVARLLSLEPHAVDVGELARGGKEQDQQHIRHDFPLFAAVAPVLDHCSDDVARVTGVHC